MNRVYVAAVAVILLAIGFMLFGCGKAKAEEQMMLHAFSVPMNINCVRLGEFNDYLEKNKLNKVWEELTEQRIFTKYENDEEWFIAGRDAVHPMVCIFIGEVKQGKDS